MRILRKVRTIRIIRTLRIKETNKNKNNHQGGHSSQRRSGPPSPPPQTIITTTTSHTYLQTYVLPFSFGQDLARCVSRGALQPETIQPEATCSGTLLHQYMFCCFCTSCVTDVRLGCALRGMHKCCATIVPLVAPPPNHRRPPRARACSLLLRHEAADRARPRPLRRARSQGARPPELGQAPDEMPQLDCTHALLLECLELLRDVQDEVDEEPAP